MQGLTIPPPRPGLWAELRYLLDALARKTGLPPATPPPAPAPEPKPAPAPRPKPAAKPATYTVARGDSLSQIATRELGDANRWRELYEANRDVVGPNPNLIHPGQVLKLPGKSAATSGPEPATRPAPAPKPEPGPAPKPGHGKTPYINQYSPAGTGQGYTNGSANCGPTSVAMIARAFGYRKDLSDAKLINHLGKIGHTTGAGTGVNGISAMGQAMGLRAQVKGPGAHVDWIRSELRAGRMVVANGDYHAMAPHKNNAKTSGHYVLVYGLDDNGRFLVHDPADRRVQSVSATELATFIKSNPNGGWQISIGK